MVSVGGGCSGTLIAPNVVLCARHCGAGPGSQIVFGDNLNGGGLVFRTVQSSFLPDGGGSLLDGGDVSILTLSSPVPASVAVPMRLIDETNELEGMRCDTVGYGLNGLGSSGHNFSSDGYRWGGENIIDRYGSPASGGGGSNIISTDFDNGSNGANSIGGSSPNPLQYEATTAGGDSGGPVLVELGGEWVIAGVLSGGTTSTSTYGDVSWWTGTAVYRTAIESRGGEFGIPAPGACCFANGSCVSVFNDECDSAGGSFEGASTNHALHHLVLHHQLGLAALAHNALISPHWGAPMAAESSLVLDPNVSTTTAPLVRVAWAVVVAALSCPPTSAAALVEPLTLSTVRRVHAHHPHVLKT